MLGFLAQAGNKMEAQKNKKEMEAFRCRIPPSCTQSRGQKWDAKIWLPFLPDRGLTSVNEASSQTHTDNQVFDLVV
jgi:hypothetical protein